MHMADALLSPVVGGAFWAASAGLIGWSSRRIATESDGSKTVLMGVLGAFVFAAQMINFTIPGTGSSGHIGGGLLLAVLLGPWRAIITIASVLVIQALLFADGGLLALGCNIFNLGVFPALLAWPLIYRPVAGDARSPSRLFAGSILAAVASIEMGALSVVLQTTASGISDLPFRSFLLFMLPIHLAIGIVEGVVTWGVLSFVSKSEPELLSGRATPSGKGTVRSAILFAALLVGGSLSWLASKLPDGLEWSIMKSSGRSELAVPTDTVHDILATLQNRLAILPDYNFRDSDRVSPTGAEPASSFSPGTSVSGIAGSLLVLLLAGSGGLLFRKRQQRS